VKIIYTTHYEISQTELNDNFTLNNSIKILSNLSDPIEIYHNLKGNYIVYEAIGILYAYPLDIEKPNNLGISSSEHLPNTLRANSKLNIDWIHDLFYWINDSKQILVANFKTLNKPIIVVNKMHYSIKHLAINPIDSIIIWCEFDRENNRDILYKSFQDGSHPIELFETDIIIKRIAIDFRSKRLFYVSSFHLYSIRFDGRDERTVFSDATSIYEFDILGDYIYWTEYNDNHFFRANFRETQTIRKQLSLSENINIFQIVHYWKQPNGTNRCLDSNCSELCLPVDEQHYRCCQNQICFDSQKMQTVRELVDISIIDQTINSSLSTIPSKNTNTLETTNSYFQNDDKNNSSSMYTEILANEEKQNTILENNTQTIIVTDPSTNESNMNTDKEYRLTTNQNSLKNLEKYSNDQNNENNLKLIAKNKTIETTVEILSNNTETVIKVDELKEYVRDIKISWIHLIIYGTIILISGIFLGSILSTLTIKLYGKQKW
jgi:hypothetical protein